MTEAERAFLQTKLAGVAHLAFVDVRNLALRGADAIEQIRDLADVAELIPELILDWADERYALLRAGLAGYAGKYGWAGQRLIETLDQDRTSYAQRHADMNADLWNSEPAGTAG